jgi:hypothetical protein
VTRDDYRLPGLTLLTVFDFDESFHLGLSRGVLQGQVLQIFLEGVTLLASSCIVEDELP